jgi:hypothetical protein
MMDGRPQQKTGTGAAHHLFLNRRDKKKGPRLTSATYDINGRWHKQGQSGVLFIALNLTGDSQSPGANRLYIMKFTEKPEAPRKAKR